MARFGYAFNPKDPNCVHRLRSGDVMFTPSGQPVIVFDNTGWSNNGYGPIPWGNEVPAAKQVSGATAESWEPTTYAHGYLVTFDELMVLLDRADRMTFEDIEHHVNKLKTSHRNKRRLVARWA